MKEPLSRDEELTLFLKAVDEARLDFASYDITDVAPTDKTERALFYFREYNGIITNNQLIGAVWVSRTLRQIVLGEAYIAGLFPASPYSINKTTK